jgi:hypothetical protein
MFSLTRIFLEIAAGDMNKYKVLSLFLRVPNEFSTTYEYVEAEDALNTQVALGHKP